MANEWPLEEVWLEAHEVAGCASLLKAMERACNATRRWSKRCNALHEETKVLRRLKYRHKSQHRRCKHFHRLEGVLRHLRHEEEMKLSQLTQQIGQVLVLPMEQDRAMKWKHENRPLLPVSRTGELVLRKMWASAQLMRNLHVDCLKTAQLLLQEIAQSFFMSYALTVLASVSRISVLAMHQMVQACEAYNAMVELLPWMPDAQTKLQEELQTKVDRGRDAQGPLPKGISWRWTKGLAHLNQEDALPAASALIQSRLAKALGKRKHGEPPASTAEDIGRPLNRKETDWDAMGEEVLFLVEDREGSAVQEHLPPAFDARERHQGPEATGEGGTEGIAQGRAREGPIPSAPAHTSSGHEVDIGAVRKGDQETTRGEVGLKEVDLDAWLGHADRKKKRKKKDKTSKPKGKGEGSGDSIFNVLWGP